MIFLTVGTQLHFDRLTAEVDRWAGERGRTDVFGQVGPTELDLKHINTVGHLDPDAFNAKFDAADAVIGHAGTGTIFGSLRAGKPLLIMPRRASLGEQRNEHQLATARRFQEFGGFDIAFEAEELFDKLDALAELAAGGTRSGDTIGAHASDELITAVRAFVRGD